jgi:hypothetical protein
LFDSALEFLRRDVSFDSLEWSFFPEVDLVTDFYDDEKAEENDEVSDAKLNVSSNILIVEECSKENSYVREDD